MGKVYECLVLTGGGSGGHVISALAVADRLPARRPLRVEYIGSRQGVERQLVGERGFPYHPIPTGKLRRYFSWENAGDFFRVLAGLWQAWLILGRYDSKKTLVFSFGGFVSVPVALAARLRGLPVWLHEQTSRVGLANRIVARVAARVFISFESSRPFFPAAKTTLSGYPLRRECFDQTVRHPFGDGDELPLLLVTGGGNGSVLLNDKVVGALPELLKKYRVIHQVGRGLEENFASLKREGYTPVGLIGEEIIDLYKSAHIVLSRAGAGTVCELLALGRRSIFVPLKIAQRNEQYHNAWEAREKLGSMVISEDEFSRGELLPMLEEFERQQREVPPSAKALDGAAFLTGEIVKGER